LIILWPVIRLVEDQGRFYVYIDMMFSVIYYVQLWYRSCLLSTTMLFSTHLVRNLMILLIFAPIVLTIKNILLKLFLMQLAKNSRDLDANSRVPHLVWYFQNQKKTNTRLECCLKARDTQTVFVRRSRILKMDWTHQSLNLWFSRRHSISEQSIQKLLLLKSEA
jgi:hypothetical protein